jgi:hypothetical protein
MPPHSRNPNPMITKDKHVARYDRGRDEIEEME